MKRHEALIPLTHDHHHALARARRLRRAATTERPEEHRAAGEEFLQFFGTHSVLHFREEEEEILPMVIDRDDAPTDLLSRLLLEHVRMHSLVRTLRGETDGGRPRPRTLQAIGELLAAHIRTEEDELFPMIQNLVSEVDLRSIRLPPRRREPPPR